MFKDREKYVTGDFRFKCGYCKSNPRRMVRLWAEKERRNYFRLKMAGILCPEVKILESHLMVMTFIGKGGM